MFVFRFPREADIINCQSRVAFLSCLTFTLVHAKRKENGDGTYTKKVFSESHNRLKYRSVAYLSSTRNKNDNL